MSKRVALAVKRAVDVVAAVVLLAVALPGMAAIAIGVVATAGRPVIFRQARPGKNSELFTIYKFRTMRPPRADENQWATDEQRVTRLGAFLRKASLDELPELFNVLRGDMSLVGPRPLLPQYVSRYSERHSIRQAVRPGLTGLAQVMGRRELTLGERLDLDADYVERWSLRLDIKILLATPRAVLSSSDISGQVLSDVDDLGFHNPEHSS